MQADPERAGRALVRQLLIERLDLACPKRRRGMSTAQHDEMSARLVARLAYMTPENLRTLAYSMVAAAKDGVWPAEGAVLFCATGLQPEPEDQHPIFCSWLASVEGPKAEAEGYLVELYGFLRSQRVRRAPSEWELRELREQAKDNARSLARIRASAEPTAQERRELASYEAAERAARAIVAQGNRKREGQV